MMDYEPLSPEETARLMQEERRREEERLRREAEQRQQQMLARQRSQSGNPMAGGIDPSTALSAYQSFAGGSAGGAGAGGGASGAASGGMSAWPVAVAALALGQHEWAKRKGLHTDSDALTGRALYKDSEYYQQKGNEKVSGLGDEMRLAAMGSSPADLFRKETWATVAKLGAKGGILGGLLKKIF